MTTMNNEKGCVLWDSTPPTGIVYQTHKFSLLDAIERASINLRTDHSKVRETLVLGQRIAAIIATLPHFDRADVQASGLLQTIAVEGHAVAIIGTVGCLAQRQVCLDQTLPEAEGFLCNDLGDKVLLRIVPERALL